MMFAAIAAVTVLAAATAQAVIAFDNSFYSAHNKERAVRKTTTLIILHTTEAPSKSALRKLSDLGECHYCIDEAGRVYRIIDHRREAYHAGRSLWNGRSDVDGFSVGIEVSGYHDKPLAAVQYQALSELIGELQHIYNIPDHCVLAHSHVAYGAPNKWQKRSHRGRKRCGMMFALPSVRVRLNLKTRPALDPDVKAGRLVVGDPYLEQVLYGTAPKQQLVASMRASYGMTITKDRSAWDIARDAYNDAATLYAFPDGTVKRGNQVVNFKLLPPGTKVTLNLPRDNRIETYQVIGVNGRAQDIAGEEVRGASTFYIYPDGRYVRGSQLALSDILKLPYGTKVLVGYSIGGPISPSRLATDICGNRWRSPDTFFLMAGTLVPGSQVDDSKIPAGTMLFFKN
ncbi:MAG: N-acetylmuramoyl-L-alanine amidase [Verrucomicrobiota bacterium]|jgi:hypothetical protein|nr:N-acetylmuramoyl-L-alanine amidase [Verrucomicrobiota bacterium]